MTLKRSWAIMISLASLTLVHNAFAVSNQMSSAMKNKMQSICYPTKELSGGWQMAKVTPAAERSLSMVLYQMNATDKLKAINEVRTQMAAGTHYAFEFELQDGQVWNAMVFHSARGDYMIERHAKKGALCPKETEE
ncbi:hypothetical protein ATG66_1066 [Vibrio sp. ES.051]|uniref:cystatin n=1 Tax=Vibrio sp. ES.051 TaxID=1761909 RepID=UPI000BF2B83F|nr:cystatin [Vibrio sp. ES.051]PFG58515.1 hypothetical protein ATG66_1066 [Vibrio sp. ES.051]